MEMDSKVLEALELLQQAGRMDLVKEEALAPGRPARRASAGVAAACSPPLPAGGAQVRGVAQGVVRRAGMGAAGAGKESAGRRGLDPGSPRVSLGVGRPQELRSSWNSALRNYAGARGAARQPGQKKVLTEALSGRSAGRGKGPRAGPRRAGVGDPSGRKGKGNEEGGSRSLRPAVFFVTSGGAEAPREGGGEGPQKESAGLGDQGDPRVPVSKKWPTILIWSSSDEEGVPSEGEGEWSEGEGPSAGRTLGAPKRVYGSFKVGTKLGDEESSVEGDVLDREGVMVARGQRGVLSYPGTPDLVCQGPLDFGEEDPGEQEAARTPWDEVKAGSGAASWMASTGWRGRRREAADASSERCGGVGYAPPDAAAWEEQRPGPSRMRSKSRGDYTGCALCGGSGEHEVVGGLAQEEVVSDVSLEEGELRNSGSEAEWWERQERGGF
ncbi:hypothetical protein NDU88_003971 [Pleurodeles waltl]|uniref:Uncharacterized protein n=1 Tax=Pleurodeles waltl TaxID=8319 RepID=A0AAV7PB36_PLEWA|nr:hypothetical protein NDU88_003971 [Pleurodeles waltl]